MATVDFLFEEGMCIFEPPLLDVNDFNYWCFKIEVFLKSINFDLWDIVVSGSCGSHICENMICRNKSRIGLDNDCFSLNVQACGFLLKSLNSLQLSLFDSCKCANHLWMRLQDLYSIKEEASSIPIEDNMLGCFIGLEDGASSSNEEFEDFGCLMGFGPSEVKLSPPLQLNFNDCENDLCNDSCCSTSGREDDLDEDFVMLLVQMKNKKIRKGVFHLMKSLEEALHAINEKDKEISSLKSLHENSLVENEILVETLKCENLELRKENEKLEHDHLGFLDRAKFYEKLQRDHDEMNAKLNDLNACLNKLTLENDGLERQLGKKEVGSCLDCNVSSNTLSQASTCNVDNFKMHEKKKNVNHAWKYVRKHNNINACLSANLDDFDSFYLPKRNMNFNEHISCNDVKALKGRMMRQNGSKPFGAPYRINKFGNSKNGMYHVNFHRNDNSCMTCVNHEFYHGQEYHRMPYTYGNLNASRYHVAPSNYVKTRKFVSYANNVPNVFNAHLVCHYCGVFGHVSSKCLSRIEVENGLKVWKVKTISNMSSN